MRLPAVALTLAAAALPGCSFISFSKPASDEEIVLRAEIRSYYDEVSEAFAGANADALSQLYDDAIARPMTRDQILAWGKDFFKKHGPAQFKIVKVDIESLGHVGAVVTIAYRVDTRDGAGAFRGAERDELVKRGRRWYVAAWEKLPER